ncbi:sensor histidine kinase, partial [Kitasatospora sp. NPDC001574]
MPELTGRLREERAARARHAVTEERVRTARELHDMVAHHLSVISVQAGLAEYVVDFDPATARASLTTIGSTGRETLEKMRGLLPVLRIAPVPGAWVAATILGVAQGGSLGLGL